MISAASLMLIACKSDFLVEEKWEFDEDRWVTGDAKSIEITAPDTQQAFKLDIVLEHNTEYDFQNLYVKTNTKYPSGKIVS